LEIDMSEVLVDWPQKDWRARLFLKALRKSYYGDDYDIIEYIKRRPDHLFRLKCRDVGPVTRKVFAEFVDEFHDPDFERVCFIRWCKGNRKELEKLRTRYYHFEIRPNGSIKVKWD